MNDLYVALLVVAYWLGSFLVLKIAIFVTRHAYTPRGRRILYVSFALVASIALVGAPIVALAPAALVISIPAGPLFFSLELLLLAYRTRIQEGGMCDWELEDNGLPEARDYSKHTRILAAFLRFSDWFEPKTPKVLDRDE